MLPEFFEFWNPTKVVYGPGLARDFEAELAQLGVQRLFVVTDEVLHQKVGLVQPVLDGLKAAGVEVAGVFDRVPVNSEVGVCRRAADAASASGADGLLAVGGGSVIDTAKAANILVSLGGDLVEDYSGAHTMTQPLKPLIVIPTTAGTGSEVTMAAVILDEESHSKLAFMDKYLLPNLAVLDPELLVSLPPGMTAATGMDAMTHACEAYWGLQKSPAADAFAAQAVRMMLKSLPAAVRDGTDLEARGATLIAASLAGVAFSHSMVGVVHAMAHACGGLYGTPHGTANAILLPHGMEYNLDDAAEPMADLAAIMGVDTAGLDTRAAAEKAIARIRALTAEMNELCGMPTRLRDAGIPEDGLPALAEAAVMDGSTFYNPRAVDEDAVLATLKSAY